MAGTPLKTAKNLQKLLMVLDFAVNAAIEETPRRYTDMYELADPLPEGDSAAELYCELRHAVSNAHWHVEQLLAFAKAKLNKRQLDTLAEIENGESYQLGRYELTWTRAMVPMSGSSGFMQPGAVTESINPEVPPNTPPAKAMKN